MQVLPLPPQVLHQFLPSLLLLPVLTFFVMHKNCITKRLQTCNAACTKVPQQWCAFEYRLDMLSQAAAVTLPPDRCEEGCRPLHGLQQRLRPTDIGPGQAAPAAWPLAKAKMLLPPEELLPPVAVTQAWFHVCVCWPRLGVTATLPKATLSGSISLILR